MCRRTIRLRLHALGSGSRRSRRSRATFRHGARWKLIRCLRYGTNSRCVPRLLWSRDGIPIETEAAEVLAESVGVVCAGLAGARRAIQLASCFRKRTRGATHFNDAPELNAA